MTRPSTKRRERFFAEEAARLLGANWVVGVDRECPDFVVTEGARKFGLEVCEVFAGPQSSSGAQRKRLESTRQREIDVLRRKYESCCNVALHVRFVGHICADNLARVVPTLIAEDLSSKPKGHRAVIDVGRGLRVHVTCEVRSRWYRVDDRVGFVDHDPTSRLAEEIARKAERLPAYVQAVGPDVRLLLVADRQFNSGKLMLDGSAALDPRGFRKVYFMSHPESVFVFE